MYVCTRYIFRQLCQEALCREWIADINNCRSIDAEHLEKRRARILDKFGFPEDHPLNSHERVFKPNYCVFCRCNHDAPTLAEHLEEVHNEGRAPKPSEEAERDWQKFKKESQERLKVNEEEALEAYSGIITKTGDGDPKCNPTWRCWCCDVVLSAQLGDAADHCVDHESDKYVRKYKIVSGHTAGFYSVRNLSGKKRKSNLVGFCPPVDAVKTSDGKYACRHCKKTAYDLDGKSQYELANRLRRLEDCERKCAAKKASQEAASA